MVQSAEWSLQQIYDRLGVKLPSDSVTGNLVTIDAVHSRVHKGETFIASYRTADGAPAADNADIEILLQVGAALTPHFVFENAAAGEAELELFEGPTVNAAGTPVTAYNMDRQAIQTATMTVTHTPTLGGDGTRILHKALPGGTHPRQSGSTTREGTEWNLKRDTDYLIRLINRSGANSTLGITLQWYEEPRIAV